VVTLLARRSRQRRPPLRAQLQPRIPLRDCSRLPSRSGRKIYVHATASTLAKGSAYSTKVTRLFGIEHLVAPGGTDEKNYTQ